MVGPDGRFLKVNQALCALVGHPEPALLAAGYQAVVHPEDRDADIEQLQRLLDGEATGYQLQQRCRRVDGEAISVLSTTWLATTRHGEPLHLDSQGRPRRPPPLPGPPAGRPARGPPPRGPAGLAGDP